MSRELYNNKLYALGAMESSVGLYYNKEILDEAGIQVPDAGSSMDAVTEFLDISEKTETDYG